LVSLFILFLTFPKKTIVKPIFFFMLTSLGLLFWQRLPAQDSLVLAQNAKESFRLMLEDDQSAKPLAEATLSKAVGQKYWSIAADCHSTLGNLEANNGDTARAFGHLRSSVDYRRLAGDSIGVANVYNTVSNIEANEGNYPKAIFYGLLSNRMLEQLATANNQNTAFRRRFGSSFLTLSKAYAADGQYDLAKAFAQKGYDALSGTDLQNDDGAICLANRYYDLFDHEKETNNRTILPLADSARYYYGIYLKNTRRRGGKAIAYHNLARLAMAMPNVDWEQARKYLQMGYQDLVAADEGIYRFYLYCLEGDICMQGDKKPVKAFGIYKKANEMSGKYEAEPDKRLDFYKELHVCASSIGQLRMALYASEQASRLQDSLFSESKEREKRNVERLNADARINMERAERERATAEERVQKQRMLGIALALGGTCFLLLLLYYIDRRTRSLQVQNKVKALSMRFSDSIQRELRDKFAIELHDRFGTPLASLASIAEVISLKAEENSDIFKMSVSLTDMLRERAQYARDLSKQLEADKAFEDGQTDFDLEHFLQEITTVINTAGLMKMGYKCPSKMDIPVVTKTYIGAIVDELVGNAIRYAKAKNINIEIGNEANQLHLVYVDDGIGIKEDAGKKLGGGLVNIEKRVRLVGGELVKFKNREEGGLIVELYVPNAA
jgi:signal transduction histidine kinase